MLTRTHNSARPPRRWRWLLLLLGTALLSTGCSPLTILAYFLMPERMEDPECLLARKEKPTRIAVLSAFENLEIGTEMARMDETLGQLVSKELETRFKDNDPKVKVVPQYKVRGFMNRHAGTWRLMDPQELGKKLDADMIVYLQIHKMTMFNGNRQLYSGHAEIDVKVVDLDKPDGENTIFPTREFECHYPKAGNFLDASDMGPVQFRAKFMDRVSREISRFFAPYEPRDKFDSD
jgi:hypothetical protein